MEKKLCEAECITNKKFEVLTHYLDTKSADIDRLKALVAEKSAEIEWLLRTLKCRKELQWKYSSQPDKGTRAAIFRGAGPSLAT